MKEKFTKEDLNILHAAIASAAAVIAAKIINDITQEMDEVIREMEKEHRAKMKRPPGV